MRKTISVLLSALLLTSAAAVGVSAAEDYTGKTVILYTGNLRGDVDVYPKIAAKKAEYAAKGADVVLVDAGNYLQGSAEANTDRGLSIYALMDAAGYDAAAMGLAEFSYTNATTGMPYHGNVTRYHTQKMLQEGTEAITYNVNRDGSETAVLAAKDAARFQTLASNVTADMETYSFEESAVIGTGAGYLGFFAVTDPEVKDNVQDGYVTSIAAPGGIDVPDADVSVCLVNASGWAGISLLADVVIAAPTGGEAVVGAYVIDNATGEITLEEVSLSGSDEAVAALARSAKENAAKTLGKSAVILNGANGVNRHQESNLGDLTADALAWYAENYIDGIPEGLPIVAIQNGGNCDQFLYTGDITETDLLNALPFSPMGIGVLVVTGAELLEALEAGTSPSERYGDALCPGFAQVSGLKYTVDWSEDYDGGEAYGNFYVADSVNRVTVTEVGGAAFDPAARYAVAADNYVLNGSDTYYVFARARETEDAVYINNGNGVLTRDVVAMYIEKVLGGTVGEAYAAPQGRITLAEETDGPLTRAEAVSVLYALAGSPDAAGLQNPFADVTEGAEYDAILWAVETGITNGVDETHFAPGQTITREQAATFLYRYVQSRGGGFTGSWMFLLDYPDRAEVSEWAYEALCWTAMNGVFPAAEDGTLSPGADCTGGVFTEMLERCAALPLELDEHE